MADFASLVTRVVNDEFKRYETDLAKAFEAAKNELDHNYKALVSDFQGKLLSYLTRARERLEGEKAKLEVDVKRTVSQQKEVWLEKVFSQAKDKLIREFVRTNEYKEIIKSLATKLAKDGAVIYCSPNDVGIVKEAVEGMNVKVVEDKGILGGLRVSYPNEGLSKDYSLDLVLIQVFEDLKGQIASVLFGEK